MLYLALILGFTSSIHCVGMCGPIVLALPVHNRSAFGKIVGVTLYNVGRIFVYAIFGLIAGSIGLAVGEWQNWVSIGAGALLLAVALGVGGVWDSLLSGTLFQHKIARLGTQIRKRLHNRSFFSLAVMGSLNGLLPCGMVYLALISALAMPDSFTGATYMAVFGLGTLPAMMLTAFMGQWASIKWRMSFKKLTPYLVALAGIVLIVRGIVPESMHPHHHQPTTAIPVCIGE